MQLRDLLPSTGVDIKSEPNRLVVTWHRRSGCVVPLMVGFMCFWLVLWLQQEWGNPTNMLLGLALLATMAFGWSKMARREIVTVFELERRRVTRTERAKFSQEATATIGFAEIASLGAKEVAYSDSYTYSPVITLKTGGSHTIGITSGSAIEGGRVLDTICAATGLPRIDIPWNQR